MQIETSKGEKSVASQGVGGTGLGLGIAGTALGLLNGGIIGLLNGGNGRNANGTTECNDTRTIGALEAELAREKAERYADNVSINTFKESQKADEKLSDRIAVLENFAHNIDKDTAVEKQRVTDNFAFLNNKIDTTKNEIMCYCNATFVPGQLVMPLDNICPQAMQRYNSWEAPTSSTSTT